MSLVVDNRAALADQPGVHVLIVGVSAYANLPPPGQPSGAATYRMNQLSSTSLTARKVYRWLVGHADGLPMPLATIRVLVSPTPGELAIAPDLADLTTRATMDEVESALSEWREDASTNPENRTIFYFAGHGASRSILDSVLLMEDFGQKNRAILRNAIDANDIFAGMAPSPSRQKIARNQLYFIDACRNHMDAFKEFAQGSLDATPIFGEELPSRDDRSAPIYFAAMSGTKALAFKADQTLFSKALLSALENDAFDYDFEEDNGRWHIDVNRLGEALTANIEALNLEHGTDQEWAPGGTPKNVPLFFSDAAPNVTLTLDVKPNTSWGTVYIDITDDAGMSVGDVPDPIDTSPLDLVVPAGIYRLGARVVPPQPALADLPSKAKVVRPPRFDWRINVTAKVTP